MTHMQKKRKRQKVQIFNTNCKNNIRRLYVRFEAPQVASTSALFDGNKIDRNFWTHNFIPCIRSLCLICMFSQISSASLRACGIHIFFILLCIRLLYSAYKIKLN